jgi:hypothetical protein
MGAISQIHGQRREIVQFDQDRWQILALDQVPEKTLEIVSALPQKRTC